MIFFVFLSFIFASVLCLYAFLCFFDTNDVALFFYIPAPSQDYDSCYQFVWCVRAFDITIWLGTFCLEFSSEFSFFVI